MAVKGNPTVQIDYSFVHPNPPASVNYYRIKVVDKDGKYIYTNVISLKRSGATLPLSQAYPNPFTDKLQLAVMVERSEFVTIDIYNGNGAKIRTERTPVVKGLNLINISGLAKLASGIYMLEVKDDAVIVKSKMVKAN